MLGIISWSLHYRLIILAGAAALLAFGIFQLRSMPVDALPEFGPTIVEIQTEAQGLSAAEVENLVTLNLEDFLHGTAGVESIQSRSVPGLSSIILIFRPGTDVARARQLVQERLTVASFLPRVSKPPTMLQPLSATSRVMMIGLSSSQLTDIEMSVLARWKIRPALMGVPGVANVAMWGQRRRQLQVQVDPERMRAHNVALDRAVATSGNALWFSPLLGIRHVLPISTPDDLANVAAEAPALNLGDVAQVVENHPLLIGDAVLPGGRGLVLVVEKFPGSTTLDVTHRIETTLQTLSPALDGMEFDTTVFRPASYIEDARSNVTTTLLIAAALFVFALLGLFFQWRAVLISLVAIPAALLTAVLVLHLRGATLNAMVLGGLALALVILIDDAVADVQNIVRLIHQHRAEGRDGAPVRAILNACSETRGGAMFATLIVGLTVLPIFLMDGASGALYQPLALSYLLALTASMAVALTVTPALAVVFLANAPTQWRASPVTAWLHGAYARALERSISNPRLVFLAAGFVVVGGLAFIPALSRSPLPGFKESHVVVQWEGAPGTSQPEMVRIASRASDELRTIPGVRNVNAHVGRAVLGDQVVGINSGQLWVSVDPRANYDATVRVIRETAAGYPGMLHEVHTYLDGAMQREMADSAADIVIRVYGPNFSVLERTAEAVRQAVWDVPGLIDPRLNRPADEPTVEIKVDIAKAERYGLRPGDVRRAASTQINGLEVGSLYEEQKVFDVVVWAIPGARSSLTSIRDLLIDAPVGGRVRLADVAEVRLVPAPTVIRHEANSRHIDISASVRGRDVATVTREVERRIQGVSYPFEYHAELVGDFAERSAADRRLLLAGLVAIVGIFLLLQAAFDSWRLAALAFIVVPAALAGGVFAAFLGGGVISLGSLIGFLAVLGIAVRHAIMVIRHYQRLESDDGTPAALATRGVLDRFTPILTTTVTAGLFLAPFILGGNRAGFEIAHPLAVVVLGGLITSALLNLFVIPAVYLQLAFPQARALKVRSFDLGALKP
jgi:CzcA family heavy metal efflux pump